MRKVAAIALIASAMWFVSLKLVYAQTVNCTTYCNPYTNTCNTTCW